MILDESVTLMQTFPRHRVFLLSALLCGLVVCRVDTALAQAVTFVRERIRVFVEPSAIAVDGTYYFTTTASEPHPVGLYYPLPVDSLHPFPDSIRVVCEGDTLVHRRVRDGAAFTVELAPERLTAVIVGYRQMCRDSSGCYILTSTSAWRLPLERADFEIYVPPGIELLSLTYDAQATVRDDGVTVYRFSREQFRPDRELCMRWRLVRG
ncbi:MAG: hypothetical protein OEO21_02535 [Candidatus Krumholzibacteria bacterium]|nr:hypothetical protein [Candidatus Krumholzibacteria bacterium]